MPSFAQSNCKPKAFYSLISHYNFRQFASVDLLIILEKEEKNHKYLRKTRSKPVHFYLLGSLTHCFKFKIIATISRSNSLNSWWLLFRISSVTH